jgi:hypothetical protein
LSSINNAISAAAAAINLRSGKLVDEEKVEIGTVTQLLITIYIKCITFDESF